MSFYSLMNLQHLKEYWAESKQSLIICCMNKMKSEGGDGAHAISSRFQSAPALALTGPATGLALPQHNKMANRVNGSLGTG